MRSSILLSACVFASVLPGVVLAQDFVRAQTPSGVCVAWNEQSIPFFSRSSGTVDVDGDAELTAVEAALAAWQRVSDACSDRTFQNQGRFDAGTEPGGANVVSFRDVRCADVVPQGDACQSAAGGCGDAYDCWDHDDFVLAQTTLTYENSSGRILGSRIELNGVLGLFTTAGGAPCEGLSDGGCVGHDVQGLVTRELGVAVGLAQIDRVGSTMDELYDFGDLTRREIDVGTASGFCTVYPKGRGPSACDAGVVPFPGYGTRDAGTGVGSTDGGEAEDDGEGESGNGCGCSGTAGGAGFLGALVALAHLTRQQRR